MRVKGEMERQYLKKGPWMGEEDEVLIKFVTQNGPRNWSSIRSNGLLPRTGKSCRLRWVNKLQPNLKTGCKFTEEEERMVIELQAEFGNKWAKIATYLQGRTDNDVKNFWSSRRKKLERVTKMPLSKSCKERREFSAGMSSSSSSNQGFHQYAIDFDKVKAENTIQQGRQASVFYDGITGNDGRGCPTFEEVSEKQINKQMVSNMESSSCYPAAQPFEQPQLDQGQVMDSNPTDFKYLLDLFEKCDGEIDPIDPAVENDTFLATPNDFFDDFPAHMFDYFDLPPPCSSN